MSTLKLIGGFRSKATMVAFCVVVSFLVLGCSVLLQWLVYDDWLHETGPIHIIGSALAAVATFLMLFERLRRTRERQQEMLRHFQTIADMNDRIRNSLQAIECSTYATNPDATEPVRNAVDRIEEVLSTVIADFPRPAAEPGSPPRARSAAASPAAKTKAS